MSLGMLVSAAVAAFALPVALGHPIDAQLVSAYGWSILIIGSALFAVRRFGRSRSGRSA